MGMTRLAQWEWHKFVFSHQLCLENIELKQTTCVAGLGAVWYVFSRGRRAQSLVLKCRDLNMGLSSLSIINLSEVASNRHMRSRRATVSCICTVMLTADWRELYFNITSWERKDEKGVRELEFLLSVQSRQWMNRLQAHRHTYLHSRSQLMYNSRYLFE